MDSLKHIEHSELLPDLGGGDMSAIDERIKAILSIEMKKMSQMLIQNFTVFVKQATKLQMD